ncbi:RNA polymerase sigma factor [Butyrivibrio sp. INlla16]|uniref:RNA polymerase sigma factor n=1 Tax=Butyrivibrio sp. INlla16 TaxID=1520807 RepID=UPI001A9A342C|nr:RNA polymerase sigma factor [Butyrivibrio sp. INlla16]
MELETIFQKFNNDLLAYIYRMCDSRQFSEDIVQETFVRATVNQKLLGTLHENQVKSWLYKTARNVYIDAVRSGTFRESPDDIPESMEESEDYSNIEWTQLLEELPGRQGVIMYMRYVEGYTAEDIGKILEMPSGTVRYEISMARKTLRFTMKNYWKR